MATPNKDTAKEVYTPDHATRSVASAESVPSTASDGTDCSGFNVLAVTRTLGGAATECTFDLYYYDNNAWFKAVQSSDLVTDGLYTATDVDWFQQFNIAAVFRFKFVITAITGAGTVQVTENLSV